MGVSDIRGSAAAAALYAYIRLINATSRYYTRGTEHIEQAQASQRPLVWALWHGLNLAFVMWAVAHHRQRRAAPIAVVGDRRAVRLSILARALGVNAMEISAGQQSTSKNLELRAMLRHLSPGRETFICPDAPEGPADEPKRGVYLLARHSGALVLPFGIWASPAREMRRWDNNLLPYPFASMTAVVGEPLDVHQVSSERDFLARLKGQLTAVREEALSLSSQDHRKRLSRFLI
jgi:lysophospholipid acyltransferase (LPLAT)-like uncharacterized protein